MAGFEWGEYTESSGGDYIDETRMLTFIVSGEVFAITAVREGQGQYGPQWNVDILTDGGEELTKSFAKNNAERNDRITRLRDTIQATGEPIAAKFIKVGRRYDITGAS